ncbi:MAG: bacillithiol biosynthesis cysteine-adding enzyme BshC [Bacteroidetes bacterium RIFCSPLOWO2_12_FULL_31_6]|nr:MAG: bacillithiol biosynthesis cysteine-adding enzyme BshC [Bacteroidetes bacterium RIFCSPLOWO2_12_FULL_31_6]
MNNINIPYQQTGYFSKLIIDYLDGNEKLKPFYNQNCDIESFATIIEQRKQFPINRTILVDVLTQQYKDVDISEATKSSIQHLNNSNCFTVTTGHQLNLFTGPLYFIYKIITTINLAKELKVKYQDNDFVPVYWMATEDHDFEEINHFNLFKKRYELAKTQTGAVGKMKLDGVEELMLEIKKELGDRNETNEILEIFSNYYLSEKTFTSAIKGIVNQLFGKYGLVIIDGDDALLKQLFMPEFKSELLERKNHQLINSTSEKLKKLGYKPQVSPREINIFYLKDNLRERIVFEENKYKVMNTTIEFSENEILEELTSHPERFSPNAPMRCLYQEKVLPNLAYIGGGGELAYWLQLKELFNSNNISFPTLVLRNSVLFIDKASNTKLQKLTIEPTELFQDTETLIKNQLKKCSTTALDLKIEEQLVAAVFEGITKKAGAIDQSLQPFVAAELQKSIKAIKNIETRLIKAEKKKHEDAINQIMNIKEKLFPSNGLQERHDNIISLLLYDRTIIDELIEKLPPLKKEFVILLE